MSDGRLIIIVLGNGRDVEEGWADLHKNFFIDNCNGSYTCAHKIIKYKNGNLIENNEDFDFACCKEDYYDVEKLNNLVNRNNKITVALHNNASERNNYSLYFQGENIIRINYFNRIDDNAIWEKIKSFLDCIMNNANNYQQLYNELWEALTPKPADEAHSLRAELLMPFIPFHLYYQIDNENKESDWKDILKSCCAEINKVNSDKDKSLKNKLGELLKLQTDLPENMKKAQTMFDELKKYFTLNEPDCIKAEDCHTKIKDFADCLESVVNFIEFGEPIGCQE